jgi:hypothetical protein
MGRRMDASQDGRSENLRKCNPSLSTFAHILHDNSPLKGQCHEIFKHRFKKNQLSLLGLDSWAKDVSNMGSNSSRSFEIIF